MSPCGQILCTWTDLVILVLCIGFFWIGLMEPILPAYGRAWRARLQRLRELVRRRP